MNDRISVIYQKIVELEDELEKELALAKERFFYHIEQKKVVFDKNVAAYHKKLRTGLYRYIRGASLSHILTAPVIYSLIIPMALLDLFIFVYQAICFPVYGIKKVRRENFIVIDRHRLAYLNLLEKLNCVYCGYGNGLIAYAREVAGRTERYWCPIKHARKVPHPHSHYSGFENFGDAEGFNKRKEAWSKNKDERTKD